MHRRAPALCCRDQLPVAAAWRLCFSGGKEVREEVLIFAAQSARLVRCVLRSMRNENERGRRRQCVNSWARWVKRPGNWQMSCRALSQNV
ncbi:hypothetical protein BaRGS_00031006 [Batillaria attramentaria]|uniref:Uncharacterized protein n=1 Tax=Batillaria attramentaria TaxID=370345 RepID=A0ABD0JT21_9CAEN